MASRPLIAGQTMAVIPRYAYFVLIILTLANCLNYLDRQILSILANSIKSDLKLDDGQLGFLMGTAFSVFYAVVGIAMGRISDVLSRTKVMGLGLAIWSAMTAFGGAATGFASLSIARIGVGIGEATANPCSHSLLSDYFPARNRAVVIGIYLAGTFVGGALAMIVGGLFIQHWDMMCQSVPIDGACSLKAWKAALIAVGLPGIPLAIVIASLREPARPARSTDATIQGNTHVILREFAAALPPLTLLTVYRVGGLKGLTNNLLLVGVLAVVAVLLIQLTGDVAQWSAVALGSYAVVTWGQIQKFRDRPLYVLTFGCPTFVFAMCGAALIACIGGGMSIWAAPYAMRTFNLPPVQVGVSLGIVLTAAAIVGVVLGGWLTDRWKLRDSRAPIWIAMLSLLGGLPAILVLLTTDSFTLFLCANFVFTLFMASWGGAFGALVQDLVLPRMRGSAASAFSLVSIVVASGIGPYWAGKVSSVTGSLTAGLLSVELLLPVALLLLWQAAKRLPFETLENRLARARQAGEPV